DDGLMIAAGRRRLNPRSIGRRVAATKARRHEARTDSLDLGSLVPSCFRGSALRIDFAPPDRLTPPGPRKLESTKQHEGLSYTRFFVRLRAFVISWSRHRSRLASARTARRSTLPVPSVGIDSMKRMSSRFGIQSFGSEESPSCSQISCGDNSGSV